MNDPTNLGANPLLPRKWHRLSFENFLDADETTWSKTTVEAVERSGLEASRQPNAPRAIAKVVLE